MTTIGKALRRTDASAKAKGRARYVDDFHPPGLLHGATVRSPYPSATVDEIDTAAAEALPGVWAAITAADVPGNNRLPLIQDDYPFLAEGDVRFVGQPVALIAAETPSRARQAAALVRVTYREGPAVFDPLEALGETAPELHEPGNLFAHHVIKKGKGHEAFAQCDVVAEGIYTTGHQVHLYLEPQGMVVESDGQDGLVVRGSMQCPYYVLDGVARATALERNRIRVVQTETGGGFGGKEDVPSVVAAHAALLCRATGRPVKLVYDREEDFHSMSKRHPGWARVRYGARSTGELVACEIEYILNGGAYATLSPVVLWRGAIHGAGPYEIPHVSIDAKAVATNTVPCGAFRGFGQPQIAFAQESCLDELASKLHLDPAELRRKNILRPRSTTATGQSVSESCGLPDALEAVVAASRWSARRSSLTSESSSRRRGMGVSTGFYGVGLGAAGAHLDRAHASIQVEADGSVSVAVGHTDMGQGAQSVLAQIAAEALGCPFEAVRVGLADTSRVPDSGPTVASRTTVASGGAILAAAAPLRERIDGVAERVLGGSAEGVDGVFRLGSNEVSFSDVVKACYRDRLHMQSVGQWVSPRTSFGELGQGDAYGTYAYSATVADVEVDVETGEVQVLDLWVAMDVGRAINPDQVEAQIEGGSVQALGYALMEDLVLEGGRIQNPDLSGYIIPTTLDTPRIHPIVIESPYRDGPFGAKGFAELPMIGAPGAIANAVAHALAVRPRQVPVSPEWVVARLEQASREGSGS